MSQMDSPSTPDPAPAPAPTPITNANAPPPFLSKTYDMVDDKETDAIVSWSATNNSFVVWNPPEFARDLLPKYFKHNNFSSFVRQLNTYGFRKVDPDRWEFANEGFLRGQKHLLKNINRRKPAHGQSNHPQQTPPTHGQGSVGACVEVGKFGLEEEVEILKRDKNVLMQELVRLRQQQQTTDNQLQTMVQRLQGMEQRQQQMMSFLAKAVQTPGFLAQFVQQQNESNRRISAEANKKRRLRQEGGPQGEFSSGSDGQIIKYQPIMNEGAKALLRQILKMDSSPEMESFNNTNPASLMIGDGSLPSGRASGVTLQEVFPTPAAPVPDIGALVGAQEAQPVQAIPEDVVMPEISQLPEIVPGELPNEGAEGNFILPSLADGFDLDVSALGLGSMPIDIDSICPDPDIDDLLETSTFWDDLLRSPAAVLAEESSPDGASKGNEEDPKENGWNKTRNMDQLTEQMELLASDAKKV